MGDITFMKGYGFPSGRGMDYAGYSGGGRGSGFAGVLVDNRRRVPSFADRIPHVPAPSIFAKIPALDGYSEESASPYGDMLLPEMDFRTPAGPEAGPAAPANCPVINGVTRCDQAAGGLNLKSPQALLGLGIGAYVAGKFFRWW